MVILCFHNIIQIFILLPVSIVYINLTYIITFFHGFVFFFSFSFFSFSFLSLFVTQFAVLYIQFDHLLIAMKGTNRNKRIVDDHEVGRVLTLCYIDPILKGESYFKDTEEKNLYEKAENEGTTVFVSRETEQTKALRSLKQIFSGMQEMMKNNYDQKSEYQVRINVINDLLKSNEQKLESLRMRFQSLKNLKK